MVQVASGQLTAVKPGTATVTAKMGKKTAVCRVTVTKAKLPNQFLSASAGYKGLNKFRTTKKVWQWNANNKSRRYFNTKKSNKLKALKRDAKLEKVAKVRAKEIAKNFSHTRPNGKSCFTAYPKYRCVGENICYSSGNLSAAKAMEMFKETKYKYSGQGHRRNMLDKDYNVVGIACYRYNGKTYWVQCFGRK